MKTTLSSNATRWEAGFNISRILIYFGLLRFLCTGVRRDGLFPWEVAWFGAPVPLWIISFPAIDDGSERQVIREKQQAEELNSHLVITLYSIWAHLNIH